MDFHIAPPINRNPRKWHGQGGVLVVFLPPPHSFSCKKYTYYLLQIFTKYLKCKYVVCVCVCVSPRVMFKYKIKTLLLKINLATGQFQGRYKYSLSGGSSSILTESNIINSRGSNIDHIQYTIPNLKVISDL